MPCGCNKNKKKESSKNLVNKSQNQKKPLQLNTIKKPVKKTLNNPGKK